MAKKWEVKHRTNGKIFSVSSSTLIKSAMDRKVRPTDMVRRIGDREWFHASDLPGLQFGPEPDDTTPYVVKYEVVNNPKYEKIRKQREQILWLLLAIVALACVIQVSRFWDMLELGPNTGPVDTRTKEELEEDSLRKSIEWMEKVEREERARRGF